MDENDVVEISQSESLPVKPLVLTLGPAEAQSIQQIPEDVVNRIAAGEVIQRPANAIKELLENCLDAGSTQVQITLRAGGLKLLQVQDNGSGIRLDDLPILCERFTTSKLHQFSDLISLTTFGFRGEALASLSHVSLLTVTTRTAAHECAYRLGYRNGHPVDKAVACAANPGTTIQAEDLFYNAPMRRAALKSPREEFSRVMEVVSQYAIHYAPRCGFHLRAQNTGTNNYGSDLRTVAGWSRMDAIRTVIGASTAQNLVSFSSSQCGSSEATQLVVERLGLRYEGLLTTPSQITSVSSPSLKLSLFINNRLVDCTVVKRALESSYSTVLSRTLTTGSPIMARRTTSMRSTSGSSSTLFCYLNLQLPAQSLDVNVHPTKAEVHFLHEDKIVRGLQDAVEHCLLSSAQVRSFLTQHVPLKELNSADQNSSSSTRPSRASTDASSSGSTPALRPQDRVRVDSRDQRLERFLPQSNSRLSSSSFMSSTQHVTPSRPPLATMETTRIVIDVPNSPELIDDDQENERMRLSPETEFSRSAVSQITETSSLTSDAMDTPKSSLHGPTEEKQPRLTAQPVIHSHVSTPPKPHSSHPSDSLLQASTTLQTPSSTGHSRGSEKKRREVRLHSVRAMRRRVLHTDADDTARRMLRASVFVGPIDGANCLVQHATELWLVHVDHLSREFFYQLLVVNFANHGQMVLSEAAPIRQLLELGSHSHGMFSIDEALRTLHSRAPMLWDYFSIRIEVNPTNDEVQLIALPLLLDNYIPDFTNLAKFVTKIATCVNWSEEAACFEDICRLTANFYAVTNSNTIDTTLASEDHHAGSSKRDNVEEGTNSQATCSDTPIDSSTGWRWQLEHVLWPAISASMIPGHGLLESIASSQRRIAMDPPISPAFIRLTRLSDLYKVFERC